MREKLTVKKAVRPNLFYFYFYFKSYRIYRYVKIIHYTIGIEGLALALALALAIGGCFNIASIANS